MGSRALKTSKNTLKRPENMRLRHLREWTALELLHFHAVAAVGPRHPALLFREHVVGLYSVERIDDALVPGSSPFQIPVGIA